MHWARVAIDLTCMLVATRVKVVESDAWITYMDTHLR